MPFTLKHFQVLCRSGCIYDRLTSNEGEALGWDVAAILCYLQCPWAPSPPFRALQCIRSVVSSLWFPPPTSFPCISLGFLHIPPCIPCSHCARPSVMRFLCLDSPPCPFLCRHYSSSLAVLCKTVLLKHSPLPSSPPDSSALELLTFSWICTPCPF